MSYGVGTECGEDVLGLLMLALWPSKVHVNQGGHNRRTLKRLKGIFIPTIFPGLDMLDRAIYRLDLMIWL